MPNIMTCQGFDTGVLGGCGMAWLGLVVVFFVNAFARKWLAEEGGMPYNFLYGLIGGFGTYLLIVSLTGAFKWALLGGLIGSFLIGIGARYVFGGDDGY